MSTVLEKPAKKLFLTDLCHCKPVGGNPSPGSKDSSMTKQWQTDCSGIKITFSMVTVQGIVVETQGDGDILLLDDGTAVAMVKGCNKIPFKSTHPVKGHYVMLVGQLAATGVLPVIRAVKVQNLSHNVTMATIWSLEVIDELGQNGNIT